MSGAVHKVPRTQSSSVREALLSAEPGVTVKEVNTHRRMSAPGPQPISQKLEKGK